MPRLNRVFNGLLRDCIGPNNITNFLRQNFNIIKWIIRFMIFIKFFSHHCCVFFTLLFYYWWKCLLKIHKHIELDGFDLLIHDYDDEKNDDLSFYHNFHDTNVKI
jgi:hypothetical protein